MRSRFIVANLATAVLLNLGFAELAGGEIAAPPPVIKHQRGADGTGLLLPQLAAASQEIGRAAGTTISSKDSTKVVDGRLVKEVSLRLKGSSLHDLCSELHSQTGIRFRASHSVADEKVTLFVEHHPVREVMTAVERLFHYSWTRSGVEGAFRYELIQDMRSRAADEELRIRARDAMLQALDAKMEEYRPYGKMSFEELRQQWEQRGLGESVFRAMLGGGWAATRLYHRLTPAERNALRSGQELVVRAGAPDAERSLPGQWQRSIMQSLQTSIKLNGHAILLEDAPGSKVSQVRMRLNWSERGEVSLCVRTTVVWNGHQGEARTFLDKELASVRTPSPTNRDNERVNTALRGRPPFDQMMALRPEPSCPVRKSVQGSAEPNQVSADDERPPHVLSSDVWEAIHRETGLPVIADFYTRLYPAGKLTMPRQRLFDTLCRVSNDMGVRWRKEGDFLLSRSVSYFWDKQKEVPNRQLIRWAQSRNANGGLPLTDFLQMAVLTDQQLGSAAVAQAIQHCWGLREWSHLTNIDVRWRARSLALLTPAQRQRVLQPEGLPFRELTAAQQQSTVQIYYVGLKEREREGDPPAEIPLEWFARTTITAGYIPAGRYMWLPPHSATDGPNRPIAGRTADEALATARQISPSASPTRVRFARDGHFYVRITERSHGS